MASTLDPLRDPRCLVTTDSVVIDGANAVCHAPRLGHPGSPLAFVVACIVFVATLAALRSFRGSRDAGGAAVTLALFLLLGAAPGLASLALTRADRPSNAFTLSRQISSLADSITRFDRAHAGCIVIDTSQCIACEPIARFARSASTRNASLPCPIPAVVQLGEGSLGGTCTETAASLRCSATAGLPLR